MAENTQSDKYIACTILHQLGGNSFIAITGATNLLATKDGLVCKIGRNAKKVTHVKIVLNAMDTYDVIFYKIRGTSVTELAKVENVHNDQLRPVFIDNTGMALTL